MSAIPTVSWRTLLDELRRRDAAVFRAWLYDLDAPFLAGGVLTIRARNHAQQTHLERCSVSLSQCAQTALGRLITVRVELGKEAACEAQSRTSEAEGIRADFRLDRFIVAPENQLAHAAATRVLEPVAPYSLLFLHGPPGSGKSHLLMGLCEPDSVTRSAEPIYRTTREFVAEFTRSFDEVWASAFRARYIQAPLLAVDDVQDFSGKSRSQEELFHIVNARVASGAPIVLAADRPPTTIPELNERLVSRFTAGLVLAMDGPAEETRLGILRQKNTDASFGFSEELLKAVARRCGTSDLDTVLPRIDALATSQDTTVTMDLVETVLRGRLVEEGVA